MTVASQDLTAQDGNNLSGSHGNIHAEYEDMWITKKVKDAKIQQKQGRCSTLPRSPKTKLIIYKIQHG